MAIPIKGLYNFAKMLLKNQKYALNILEISISLLFSPVCVKNVFSADDAKKPLTLDELLEVNKPTNEIYSISQEVIDLEKQIRDYLVNVIEPKIKALEPKPAENTAYPVTYFQPAAQPNPAPVTPNNNQVQSVSTRANEGTYVGDYNPRTGKFSYHLDKNRPDTSRIYYSPPDTWKSSDSERANMSLEEQEKAREKSEEIARRAWEIYNAPGNKRNWQDITGEIKQQMGEGQ